MPARFQRTTRRSGAPLRAQRNEQSHPVIESESNLWGAEHGNHAACFGGGAEGAASPLHKVQAEFNAIYQGTGCRGLVRQMVP